MCTAFHKATLTELPKLSDREQEQRLEATSLALMHLRMALGFWKHCFLLGLLGSYSRTLDALQGCSNDWCCKLSGHRRSDALQEWKVRNPEPESFDWGLSSY